MTSFIKALGITTSIFCILFGVISTFLIHPLVPVGLAFMMTVAYITFLVRTWP